MNAAARVVSDTCKYDRGFKTILHDELYWLDVLDCAVFYVPSRLQRSIG